jgi:hypothetical protein
MHRGPGPAFISLSTAATSQASANVNGYRLSGAEGEIRID